jgi:aldose 1-epimerase
MKLLRYHAVSTDVFLRLLSLTLLGGAQYKASVKRLPTQIEFSPRLQTKSRPKPTRFRRILNQERHEWDRLHKRKCWGIIMWRPKEVAVAIAAAVVMLLAATAAMPYPNNEANGKMQKQEFGKLQDGSSADLYTLTNAHGMEASITNFGATLVSLKVPDKSGKSGDIVLGYDKLSSYESGKAFFGATVGRYGNRIAHAKFSLDGQTYSIGKNDGENSLHGGMVGFNKRLWTAKDVSTAAGQALELTYVSKDGEEGYPGNLSIKIIYSVPAAENALKIDYSATTDKDTVLNPTHHSYFNLAGQGNGDILQNQMTIHASRYTPVDATLIPTGELRKVAGTPFDFTKATAIGARIEQSDEQLKFGKGYDHNWVLDKKTGGGPTLAAEVYEPTSGRVMDVLTTEPGIQFYSGNFLDGTITGKDGKTYGHRSALCLETQHYPDSPNHPDFPSTELKPGQKFHSVTIYKFSTK